MENNFNFVERFAPLSSLQGTVVEFDHDRFIIAPEGMISCNLQEDHVVVWYKDGDRFGFVQVGQADYLNYAQAFAALVPIDVPRAATVSPDLMAVLESAPDEVLQAFAAWAGDYNPERYPSTREVWGWLNHTWGELRP